MVIYTVVHEMCNLFNEINNFTTCFIVGLDAHTDYDIRVLAGTKAGYADLDDTEWPWATGTTSVTVVVDSKYYPIPIMRLIRFHVVPL